MKLSDSQIERLLRAAVQATRLDEGADAPLARIVPERRPVLRHPALLMAACLGVAGGAAWFFTRPAVRPVPPTSPAIAMRGDAGAVVRATGNPVAVTRAVVLAIAEGPGGELTCVRWADQCLMPGTQLADLDTGELESIGAALTCDASSPHVLIIGLEGPASSLPASDAEALSLAGCFRASSSCGFGGFDESGCSTAACALPSVAVRVASLVR